MKKIMTLFAAAAIVGAAWAQHQNRTMPINRTVPQKQEVSVKPSLEVAQQMKPIQTIHVVKPEAKNNALTRYQSMPTMARRAALTDTPEAGYLNPDGSFFGGIDDNGYLVWAMFPVVIGTYRNGYDAWLWPNIGQNASQFEYQNYFGVRVPEYMEYMNTIDASGNWIDSMPCAYKSDFDYLFSYRVPMQIASDATNKDTFVINQMYSGRLDTVIGGMMTAAGAHDIISIDGFWPMTKAMFYDIDAGFTVDDIWTIDTTTNEFQYILGSTEVSIPVTLDSSVNIQPAAIAMYYEKPMSTLYIHDITMAINAYESKAGSLYYGTPTFDSLHLMIVDTLGNILCQTGASINDTTALYNINGSMVHFKIENEDKFGEKTIGISVNEPFMVVIYGLNNPGNNFGVYTGMNLITGGNTMVMDAKGNFTQYYYGDAFVMLNGIMNTLEDACSLMGFEAQSDTIDVKVVEDQGYWSIVYANGELEGTWPIITSIDMLYDTTTSLYYYDIEAPDWAHIDMYYNDGETDYWEDYGMYFLDAFYDTEDTESGTPQIGEEIVLSQYGKKIVYRIVGVPTALNEVKYINDGKRYDVLGKEVDENYKGIVIKNGKKFLQ